MKKNHYYLLMLAIALMAITSCQKDVSADEPVLQPQEKLELQTSTQWEAQADLVFDEIFDNVMGIEELGLGAGIGIIGKNSSGKEDSTGKCFTVTVTPGAAPNAFPKTVTIDFGNGCTGPDGRTRKGKIVTTYTGKMTVPGSKTSTTLVDFYIDSVRVKGTYSIENTSTSNNRSFTVKISDGKLLFPNGNYITLNATRTVTQTEGNGTPQYPKDDVFKITGSAASTVHFNGKTLTTSSEITEPLIKKFTCKWISKGTVKVKKGDFVAILDYGSGDCDKKATLTINGVPMEITLH